MSFNYKFSKIKILFNNYSPPKTLDEENLNPIKVIMKLKHKANIK